MMRASPQAMCLYRQPTQAYNPNCWGSRLFGKSRQTCERETNSWIHHGLLHCVTTSSQSSTLLHRGLVAQWYEHLARDQKVLISESKLDTSFSVDFFFSPKYCTSSKPAKKSLLQLQQYHLYILCLKYACRSDYNCVHFGITYFVNRSLVECVYPLQLHSLHSQRTKHYHTSLERCSDQKLWLLKLQFQCGC